MSIGLGLLDTVFAGKKGVAATLVKNFGGTATIVYRVEVERFDDETGETIPARWEQQSIAFVQELLKKFVGSGVGGVQIQEGDLVGVVAASDLEHEIVNQRDRIEWNGRSLLIASHEDIMSGNEKAMIRLLARE